MFDTHKTVFKKDCEYIHKIKNMVNGHEFGIMY